jgi:hypothetical protein
LQAGLRQTGDRIDGAARRKRHDDFYHAGWPVLGARHSGTGQKWCGDRTDQDGTPRDPHETSLAGCFRHVIEPCLQQARARYTACPQIEFQG